MLSTSDSQEKIKMSAWITRKNDSAADSSPGRMHCGGAEASLFLLRGLKLC